MVYVDDMRAKFGRMILCHMTADTLDELHAMADRIGVARKWFQGPPRRTLVLIDMPIPVGMAQSLTAWR